MSQNKRQRPGDGAVAGPARQKKAAAARVGEREIILDSNTHVTGDLIKKIGRENPNLEFLDCTDVASIHRAAFCSLAFGFGNLQALRFGIEPFSLTEWADGGSNVTEIEMQMVLQECPLLNEVALFGPFDTEAIMCLLLERGPRLRVLELNGVFGDQAWGPRSIAGGQRTAMARAVGDPVGDDMWIVAQTIRKECKKLVHLSVSMCNSFDGECLETISKGCKKLEEIEADFCYGITQASLHACGKNCKKLEHINLRKVPIEPGFEQKMLSLYGVQASFL